MKVILKEDVKKVGKRGQIVDVSDGYGRNYLIARNLAVPESKRSLEILGVQKAEEAAEEAAEVEKAKDVAKTLEKTVLEFRVKVGEDEDSHACSAPENLYLFSTCSNTSSPKPFLMQQ